jgi:hypothetical protein
MKDYRIEIKVRNAPFLRRMEAAGFDNINHLATAIGMNSATLYGLASLKKAPMTKRGEWRKPVRRVAKKLGCKCDDLFPHQHVWDPLLKNTASFEVSLDEMERLTSALSVPDDHLLPDQRFQEVEAAETLEAILDEVLTEREAIVIKARFGLSGEVGQSKKNNIGKGLTDAENTFEEVSLMIGGVNRERARQIEQKALRKLRRPGTIRRLAEVAPFLVEMSDIERVREREAEAAEARSHGWYTP